MNIIEEKIKYVISNTWKIPIESLNCESCFTDDLAQDSLDIVELIVAIEKEFNIEIPDEDINEIVRIKTLVDYVHSKLHTNA
jgi:acyl carrier protein